MKQTNFFHKWVKAPLSMHLLLVVFTAFVTLFFSCQKDILTSKIDPDTRSEASQRSISIDEAKAYYNSVKNTGNGSNSLSNSSSNPNEVRLIDVDPQWDFYQSGSLAGNVGLAVEATDAQFQFTENGNIRLFFQRDSIGNLNAKYILYMADSTYHKREQGRYENQDFTGILLVFKPNGQIIDTLMARNGGIVAKPPARILTGANAPDGFSYRCASNEYQKTYQVQVKCPQGCGCVGLCWMDVTKCVYGGGSVPIVPVVWGLPFGNPFDNTLSNSGGGSQGSNSMNMFSDADYARRILVTVGHLSSTAVRRLEATYYSEFLNLGALLSSDGEAAAQFRQYYYQGLMGGEFFAAGSDLRAFYNIITNAGITNQYLFNKVGKVFKKYIAAGFDELEFVQLFGNQLLFQQIDGYLIRQAYTATALETVKEINDEFVSENYTTDATFTQDVQLHLSLIEQSSEYSELCNSLNAFSSGGSGNDPLKAIVLDLMVEAAQEWAENFLGINDLSALRELLERGTEKAGK